MDWKEKIGVLSRVFAVAVLALFIVSAILLGLVQTHWGIKELAGWVSRLDGELTLVPGRISGVFPFRFELEQLSVADKRGVWLEARGIRVRWSPSRLIQGQVFFPQLTAISLNLLRTPLSTDESIQPLPCWVFALRCDRFAVDQVTGGEDLFGEPAVLRTEARIPAVPPGQNLEAFLKIERTDKIGSVLQASATLHGGSRFLKIEASFHEYRNGLLGKILGVEGPLSLSLSGQGTPDLWQGKIVAKAFPIGSLAADMEMKDAKNPMIKMQGQLQPELETLPSIARMWMSTDLPFDLKTRLNWPSALAVEFFALQTREIDLVLKGHFDLIRSSSAGQFTLTCRDLTPLSAVLDLPAAGKLASHGTFSREHGILRFSVTGSSENFQVGESERLLGRDFSWELRGEGPHAEVWSMKQMNILAENLRLEGSGDLKLHDAAATMEALVEVKDLRPPTSIEFLDGWSTLGKVSVSWDAVSRALSSRFQGKLKPATGVSLSFLAKDIDYAGMLSLDHGRTLNLAHLEMAAPWGKLKGKGKVDLPQETMEATWHLLLPDLDPFSVPLQGGPLEIRGQAQGPVKNPTLSAETTARGLSVSNVPLGTTRASLHAETGPLKKGSIKVDAQVQELALRSHADFDLSSHRLGLRGISLEVGASRLTGSLNLLLGSSLLEGALKAECSDLASLAPLLQKKLQGSVLLQVRLVPSEEGQRASVLMEGKNLEFSFGKVRRSKVQAHGILLQTGPRGRVALEIQDGIIGGFSLQSSALTLENVSENTSFQLAAEGFYGDRFEITASGLLSLLPTEKKGTLLHMEGRYGGTPLSLLQPATVARTPEGFILGEWGFKLGFGQFQGSGYLRPADLSLDVRFDRVPLQLFPVQEIRSLGGLARGNVRLTGSPARPEGTAHLQIETPRFQDQGLPSVSLTAHAAFRENLLQGSLLLQGLSDSPMRAEIESPLRFSLSPLILMTPPQERITGSLKGEINLEQLGRVIPAPEQRLSGLVEIDLGLSGSWDSPETYGGIRLSEGSYENLRTGTILRGIEVDIGAQTPLLAVNKASASDGERGHLSAHGQLELSSAHGVRFNLDLALEKAKLFRYDWASAVLGGDLSLAGSLSEALLTGRLVVDTAEFRIPDRLAPEIQDLQVIEINKPREKTQSGVVTATPSLWPLSLDLSVLTPGRTFLSGRGLTSEWQGEVRIKGVATQPSIEGTLSAVRGDFNFLAKRFYLKEGTVFLDGSSPPSPTIDVEAESRSRDIVAYLRLRGTAQNLEMQLSSDPPLPPDEILSRLLFGRSASGITPVQAVQLADSINTMTRGGGLDFLGRTRRMLGLDHMTLTQSGKTQEETALSAGKYLSENVYLEVQQGISPETGKASLKWEITPSVSVQTEVGVNAEAGIGVNWRWDY